MGNEIAVQTDDNVIALRPTYPVGRGMKRETILIRSAQLVFRNFTGRPGPYNEAGERSFAVLLDEGTGRELQVRGMNVKEMRQHDEDVEKTYYLPVAVSYKVRPPRIYMVTGDGDRVPLRKTLLREDMLEMMDMLELAETHMVIAVSNYDVRGSKGKKAYIQSLFGHVLMDELEQEYAHIEDVIAEDLETHAAEDEHVVIEGEIVY